MILTKELLKELKECSSMSLYRDKAGNTELKLRFTDKIRGVETSTAKSYLVYSLLNTYAVKDYDRNEVIQEADPKDSICTWFFNNYPNNTYPLNSIISTLKVGDEIRFEFSTNYYTGGFHTAKAGLVGETLMLVNKRKGHVVSQFILDEHVIPLHNLSRNINAITCHFSPIVPTDYRYVNRVEAV